MTRCAIRRRYPEGMAANNPKGAPQQRKKRWYRNTWDLFQTTRRRDKSAIWWMLLGFVVVTGLAVVVGLATGALWYYLILGVPGGILAALIIMARRAENAAYAEIEGQPGAAVAALSTLRKRWTVEKEPAAIDPRTQDMVFRVVGRPGVILVSEGPPTRVRRLLEAERRKVSRVLPNVTIHQIQCGNGEGQVPLRKLNRTVQRQRRSLSASEAAEVAKRLKALGPARLPIPKGIDPTRARPDRKAVRGR